MGQRERAERAGHVGRELWGARPLAGWCKTAANKLLARRLERRRMNRDAQQDAIRALIGTDPTTDRGEG